MVRPTQSHPIQNIKMENGTLLRIFAVFLLSALGKVYGEIVQVETQRDAHSQPCVFPRYFSATILGHRYTRKLLLKRNNNVLTSRHVILMSNQEDGGILFETEKTTSRSAAYHSILLNAAFVLKCAHKRPQGHYFQMEGSFFIGERKFVLVPANDFDVTMTTSKVTSFYVMTETREFVGPDDHGFIPLTKDQLESVVKEKEDKMTRHTRAAENYVLDILPVVDYDLYQRWFTRNGNDQTQTSDALSEYLANIFTSIAMRLESLSLPNGATLSVSVIPPHLSTSSAASPYSGDNKEDDGNGNFRVNATQILEDFKTWVSSTPGLPTYDHAMLFTSLSLYAVTDGAKGFNITKGLAYVGTICKENGDSTSVVEDNGAYQSEGVAAHEFGHSLGSLHDGQDNECNSHDRYVMSNGTYPMTSGNTGNSWRFSSCSSTEIGNIITELEADNQFLNDCLMSTSGEVADTVSAKNINDLCKAQYGSDSFVCRGNNFSPLNEMCDVFYCRIPGTNNCGRLFTAAGACCGNGKNCQNGNCVSAPSSNCNVDESCPFGDQPGVVVNGQTCAQMHSAYCYNDDVRIKCCATCKQREVGSAGCLYGDKQLNCVVQGCSGTLGGLDYDVICCGTCTEDCVDSRRVVRDGQDWSCSQYLQQYGVNECYRKDLHSEGCCETCESHRSEDAACPFGDNLVKFNCHLLPPLGRLCTDQEAGDCCETCPEIAASLTTTTTTTSTTTTMPTSTPTTESSSDAGNSGQDGNNCLPGTACGHAGTLSSMRLFPCTGMAAMTVWIRMWIT